MTKIDGDDNEYEENLVALYPFLNIDFFVTEGETTFHTTPKETHLYTMPEECDLCKEYDLKIIQLEKLIDELRANNGNSDYINGDHYHHKNHNRYRNSGHSQFYKDIFGY